MLSSSIVKGSSIDSLTSDGPSHDVTSNFLVPGFMCNCFKWKVNRNNLVYYDSWKTSSISTIYWQLQLQKAKDFSVESVWNELEEQHTKHLFKTWRKLCFSTMPILSILLSTLKKIKTYSISQIEYCDITSYIEHYATVIVQVRDVGLL